MSITHNPDKSEVILRANVYDFQRAEMTKERNIRNVRVVYVADLPQNEDTKIVILEAEMWDYKDMIWKSIYGETGLVLEPGQTLANPLYIPFASLAEVEWSTNRYSRLFHIGKREDKYNAGS